MSTPVRTTDFPRWQIGVFVVGLVALLAGIAAGAPFLVILGGIAAAVALGFAADHFANARAARVKTSALLAELDATETPTAHTVGAPSTAPLPRVPSSASLIVLGVVIAAAGELLYSAGRQQELEYALDRYASDDGSSMALLGGLVVLVGVIVLLAGVVRLAGRIDYLYRRAGGTK